MPDMVGVEEIMNEKKRPSTLELVAFARGWSTWLGHDVERTDDEGSAGETIIPGMDSRGCYFVLWVERRGDISYRLASGEVLVSWWEENREKQFAQVVLG
ncbi:hypothetical protein N0V84_008035 [Fusarium piperis]|uniref:Uncharacterized protein n=1 Tax=Fusarium piperis TaxID=1435070 RepID=A0A9W8W936_9HYPO|nr:hypothetical protein N0V84_008035 [Fusarium piperis]